VIWYKHIELTLMIPADSSLAFWLGCFAVGFAAAVLIIFSRQLMVFGHAGVERSREKKLAGDSEILTSST
jgi:hypothetical protein